MSDDLGEEFSDLQIQKDKLLDEAFKLLRWKDDLIAALQSENANLEIDLAERNVLIERLLALADNFRRVRTHGSTHWAMCDEEYKKLDTEYRAKEVFVTDAKIADGSVTTVKVPDGLVEDLYPHDKPKV